MFSQTFEGWAKTLEQEHIDKMVRLESNFPGSTRRSLDRLKTAGFIDEKYKSWRTNSNT